MTTCFGLFYSSAAIIRSSKVTLRGVYRVIECLLLQAETNVEMRSHCVLEITQEYIIIFRPVAIAY